MKYCSECGHQYADVATKTYLKTNQFIKVWQSLGGDKYKELNAIWDDIWDDTRDAAWVATRNAAWFDVDWHAAWYDAWEAAWRDDWRDAWDAARYTDLAILVKDKISDEHFEILTKPWTSCGLSLYAEDWEQVLNPKAG